MSIINYKKDKISDSEYLEDYKHVTTNGLLERKYDNIVNNLIENNIDAVLRVNIDCFSDSFMKILEDLLNKREVHDKLLEINKLKEDARADLNSKSIELKIINNKDYLDSNIFINEGEKTTSEIYSSMDDKKNAFNRYILSRDKFNNISSRVTELINQELMIEEDLRANYKTLSSSYDGLDLSSVKNFDEMSMADFFEELPYGLYSDQEYFLKEIYDLILYEVTFVDDLKAELHVITDDINVSDYSELTDEMNKNIQQTYNKYSRIKRALDIKYNVLKKSFVDASNKCLDDRKSKKAHLKNVESYRKILTYLNKYIDLVYSNKNSQLTEEELEGMEQTLGSLFSTISVDESAKSVSELYVKDYVLSADEFQHLSNPILR